MVKTAQTIVRMKAHKEDYCKYGKKGQKLLNAFWKVWRDEYLLSLRERTQNTLKSGRIQSQSVPSAGDEVLIKDDFPRGCWRFGKILLLVPSRDGHIRSAKVSLCSGHVIERPLNLQYPVEVSNNCTNEQEKSDHQSLQSSSSKESEIKQRPIRTAAKHAREKIKQVLSQKIEMQRMAIVYEGQSYSNFDVNVDFLFDSGDKV